MDLMTRLVVVNPATRRCWQSSPIHVEEIRAAIDKATTLSQVV
jgi:hypothetical protein